MHNPLDTLISRFPDNAPEPLKIAIRSTKTLYDRTREKHSEIEANRRLSPLGRHDAMRKFVADEAANILRARRSIEAARVTIDQRRRSLQPPTPEKTDAAAAALRVEMRGFLRTLRPSERAKLLLANNADPALWAAVLEAPNMLSGIDDQIRDQIATRAIDLAHPGKLAQIEAAKEALDVVAAAVRMTMNTLVAAAEFPSETVLLNFASDAVPDARRLDADVQRNFESLAAA